MKKSIIVDTISDEELSDKIKEIDNNTMIAHYTTMEGFIGLLNSVTSNGAPMLKMWASNIFALNDPTELMYGYEITHKWLPKIESQLNVNEEDKLSKIWNHIPLPRKSNLFYNKCLRESLYSFERSAYVLSFSRKHDNLAMFRMYSQDATGVCLLFSLGLLEEKNISLYDVCYDEQIDRWSYSPFEMLTTEYKLYLKDVKEQQANGNEKFELMLTHLKTYIMLTAPFIKRGDYAYEEEIRYSALHKLDVKIKFRTNKNGNIIPYIEVEVPLKAIKKLIIGPCANFNASKYAIELKFKSIGISDIPEIIPSEKEYRIY